MRRPGSKLPEEGANESPEVDVAVIPVARPLADAVAPPSEAELPEPVVATSPEIERIESNALAENDTESVDAPSAENAAIDVVPEAGGNEVLSSVPDLAGGPVFFRPVLRPELGEVTTPEPDVNPANTLVSSLRPKLRPASLVVRVAAAPLKPAISDPTPGQTRVAKPVPVPQPAVKPKPVAKPAPPAAPGRPADVVMVGDSITAGGRWASRFPDVTIVNRGISGDTGLKILARMEGILATRPKTALVMFGINDIYNGVPVERILQRYDQIISILQGQKIKVVIQSTLACSGHVCGEKLNKVYALNTGLSKMAKSRRLKYVDINKGLSDRNGLRRDFSSDGIHLNKSGNATWYAMLRPHIKG